MKPVLKIVFSTCFLFLMQTTFGQVDTAKKFVPKENSPAENKLKKEIQQKQLLEKPRPLNSGKNITAGKDSKKIHRKKKRQTRLK